MLTNIRISNYALISNLDIDFNHGFSVITGETGAGKSIILGALGLVLGERADTKNIRDGEQKCIIEADFDIEGYDLQDFFIQNDLDYSTQCTIRRELNQNGKSRSFVNDTPINLSALKELGIKLIDIHSQHQNLQLGKNEFQRQIIDRIADNHTIITEYKQAYSDYQTTKHQLEKLKERAAQEKADQDYIEFQFNQLDSAHLKAGESVELEEEIRQISHAEEIKSLLTECSSRLSGEQAAIDLIRDSEQYLTKIARYSNNVHELIERLKSLSIELKDIASDIDIMLQHTDSDPQHRLELEERYDLLNSLMSKHHVDTDEQLISIRDEFSSRLGQLNSYDEQISTLEKEYQSYIKAVENKASELSNSRFAEKQNIEKQITEQLIRLGIKHAQFEISITQQEKFTPYGKDSIEFLFAANKNQQLQDVANVASGGEISRLMLALKSLQPNRSNENKIGMPTIIFDEIDTGVSGEIADNMGKIMQQMAEQQQIISITHLPQIASRGEIHYKVYKSDTEENTETHIRKLTSDQRIAEIASMLSGNQITSTAIENAKELLNRH